MAQHLIIRPVARLCGTLRVPGDKSISHRALMLGTLAEGVSTVRGFLPARGCRATLACMRALGAEIHERSSTELTVRGRGLHGLAGPAAPLDCGGSGTTMRLLAGLLAGQGFPVVLTGNAQLSGRPMGRVAEPLRRMGADVRLAEGDRPPIELRGGALHGIDYTLPVASAQVKSAVLLAGLFARGVTAVREPAFSRDHTERMLRQMGAPLEVHPDRVEVRAVERLEPLGEYAVPGDLSSAAFLIVAATLVPGAEIVITGVGANPGRAGLLDVLASMGADLAWLSRAETGGEPAGDLRVRASGLAGVRIGGAFVPRMIDEFPILAVAATQADGVTEVRDAVELRVKESDRIDTLVAELRKLGARIEPRADGFDVEGPVRLRGDVVDSHGDHRLAMALAVAGLVAEGQTVVEDTGCIADSFPGFAEVLGRLGARADEDVNT